MVAQNGEQVFTAVIARDSGGEKLVLENENSSLRNVVKSLRRELEDERKSHRQCRDEMIAFQTINTKYQVDIADLQIQVGRLTATVAQLTATVTRLERLCTANGVDYAIPQPTYLQRVTVSVKSFFGLSV